MTMGADKWSEVRIGDLGEVLTGRTPPTERPAYFGGEYPFITPSDMHQGKFARTTQRTVSREGADLLKRIQIPGNSVCVSCIGWQMGEVIMTDRPSFTNQQINSMVPSGKIEPSFLYYSLRPRKQELLSLGAATGVRTPILNKSAFCDLKVKVPPLPLQRRISGILSAYDDQIENNQRRIKILEQMARSLYREWFVHFRFPSHEKVKMVPSTLGPIPQGWEVRTIADLCESVSYGYTASAVREDIGPKFLRITDIVPDVIEWDRVPFCKIPVGTVPKYLVKRGDIVIARTGATTGYAKRLNKRHPNTVFASYLVRVRARADVSNLMLGLLIESADYKQFIKTNIGGAAQPQANAVVLTSMRLATPPSPLSKNFDRLVEPLLDEAELLASKIQNLRRTRDLLLPRLLSGAIELAGAGVFATQEIA